MARGVRLGEVPREVNDSLRAQRRAQALRHLYDAWSAYRSLSVDLSVDIASVCELSKASRVAHFDIDALQADLDRMFAMAEGVSVALARDDQPDVETLFVQILALGKTTLQWLEALSRARQLMMKGSA